MQKNYYDDSCFSFLRYLIVLSLPLLLLAAVVASYLHYLPFKMPVHSVAMIGFIFLIFLFFIPHNAYVSSCKIVNNFKQMKSDLKQKLRSTLLKINNEKKSTLNLDKFLKNYFKDIRNDNLASIATTVFPMLGILGTFISIAVSMPDFSATSAQALDKDISLLLSGVGTAFYVSIYGIFLAIWWMFFEKRGLAKIDKYFALVKEDFKDYVWDEEMLEHYRVVQSQLSNKDLVEALRENFNIHFMKKFNDSYIQSYKELLEITTQNFQTINAQLREASKSIQTSLMDLNNSSNSVRTAIEIDKKLVDFNKAISSLDMTLDKTFYKIDHEIAQIVARLADFAEVVVKKSDEVEHSIYEYHTKMKKLLKD